MPHFKIESQPLAGFVAENAKAGSHVTKILVKSPGVTSDEPSFHVFINHIHNAFFARKNILSTTVNRFLILLHSDNTADIYLNDFEEMVRVKVNRAIKAGEYVYKKDITDISHLDFPSIEIKEDDAFIYCMRKNWKFGLYFDFDRKINKEELAKELGALAKHLEFENLVEAVNSKILNSSKNVFIVTEGKTDWQHLTVAKEKLKIDLDISFDESQEDKGDEDILAMCKHFCRVKQEKVIIFIFDSDNPKILRELEKKTGNEELFQDWGNNVYSLVIPKPSHRKQYKCFSLEFYYTDKELKTIDKDGKRLFFSNELKTEILPGRVIKQLPILPILEQEFDKKIEDHDVEKILNEQGEQVALSKANFAFKVLTKEHGFENFNYKEFQLIFDLIKNIESRNGK